MAGSAGCKSNVKVNVLSIQPVCEKFSALVGVPSIQYTANPCVEFYGIAAIAEASDLVGFRVKDRVVVCPVMANGQQFNGLLAAALTPLWVCAYVMEEVEECIFIHIIDDVLVTRRDFHRKRVLLVAFHSETHSFYSKFDWKVIKLLSLSLSIYIIHQKFFTVKVTTNRTN